MLTLFSFLIRLYQRTISPDHGVLKARFPYGWCQFYPSCSEYGRLSIEKHGYRGLWLTLKRVARCHPWSSGGIDLVPKVSEPPK